MKHLSSQSLTPRVSRPLQATVGALLLAAATAWAAPAAQAPAVPNNAIKATSSKTSASPAQEAQRLFREEMAFCASGASPQGRQVCEQEARAAHAQNLRSSLRKPGANYAENALQRCQTLAADERSVCIARIDGQVPAGEVAVVPGSEKPLQSTTTLPRE